MPRVVGAAESYRGPRLPIECPTWEGGIDPIKAVEKFDPDKGARLCIRATSWIGQSVGRKPMCKEDG